ncbi:MAG: hypothetical protein II875_03675 [Clostridia bacterium]|nr:hypothetical protein [Clostridia bacterium]
MNGKLKRILCVLLALILLLTLASCGDKKKAGGRKAEVTRVPTTPKPPRKTLVFGSYEQDDDPINGAEPIEWIILEEREDGSVVLLSKYALDCLPYNPELTPVAWKTCRIRAWLNEDFFKTAFDAQEQEKLLVTTVQNEETPHYMVIGEYQTEDRVWLLSVDEVDVLYGEDAVMKCVPTKYALARGAKQSTEYDLNGEGSCWWWLRSTGDDANRAAYVNDFAEVGIFGNSVNYDHYTVRPVVRILP